MSLASLNGVSARDVWVVQRISPVIDTEVIDGVHVITVNSNNAENQYLVSSLGEEVESLVNDDDVRKIIIDLSQTDTFGSYGNTYYSRLLEKLIEINQKCKDNEKSLSIVLDRRFDDILIVTRLGHFINIKPTLDEALKDS